MATDMKHLVKIELATKILPTGFANHYITGRLVSFTFFEVFQY